MFVLNIKGHYELLYSEKDNNKYKSIFKKYICNYIPNILVEENMVINEKTKTLETPNDIYFNEKDNENENGGNNDVEQNKNKTNNISSYKYMTPSTNKYNSHFKNISYITRTASKNQPTNNHSKTAYSVKSLKGKSRLSVNTKESSNNNSYKNNENQNIHNKITYSFSNKSNGENNKIIFLNQKKSDFSQADKNKMKFINTTTKNPEKSLGTIREESTYNNTNYKNSNGTSIKYTVPKRNTINSPSSNNTVQSKSNIIPNNNRYYAQNKTISKINTNNNNIKNTNATRYSTPFQNMNENFSINIDEDAHKPNVKESINIKSMNLAKKINEEVTKEQEINNNVNNENKPNNKLLSRILMSPKKNGTNEESKTNDYSENKCRYCSIKYSYGNENELLPNICYDCLRDEIINQVYPCYLSYIDNFAKNCNAMDYKGYFNIFIQNEITICGINISIKDAVTELFIKNNNKEKKAKNEMSEMKSLFRQIKKRFCIVCSNELDNKIYIIPCGCNFCSIEHIKKYFHLKNKLKDTLFYVCQCSHEYSFSDLYNLALFFDKFRLVSLRNDVIDILNEHLSKKCCFCNRTFNSDDVVRVRYEDFEENIQNNLILGDCNLFKHYTCKNCYKYNRREREFFCDVCDIKHFYIPR
jgi:hypothetical protein